MGGRNTLKDTTFIGFVGLHEVPSVMPFSPAVEIGWRLARPFWGSGYATEAGATALEFGFNAIGLEEIMSFTSVVNRRSQGVMERRGMRRDPREDFEHPGVALNHLLRPHVLFHLHSGGDRPPTGVANKTTGARESAPR
jgi:RimJ/RimL family protein N-acetyltransferase